jgi:hypothetical protein
VVQAPAPERPITGGMATEALLAQVLVAKVLRSPCVPNTPRAKEVWSCTRDEGGPLGVGDQELAPNRCKLRTSRAAVVSVAGTAGRDPVRCGPERRAQANR